jgi:hypothetical protein
MENTLIANIENPIFALNQSSRISKKKCFQNSSKTSSADNPCLSEERNSLMQKYQFLKYQMKTVSFCFFTHTQEPFLKLFSQLFPNDIFLSIPQNFLKDSKNYV